MFCCPVAELTKHRNSVKSWQVKLAACFSLLLPLQGYADAPVWQVEKYGRTVYLAGTIHLLSANDYPLPAAFDRAYQQSEVIYLETDGARLKSPEFQQRMLARLSYPAGDSLDRHISGDTLRALQAYFRERGMPVESMLRFRAGMLTMIMTIHELNQLGINSVGVDEFFENRARADGKKLGQLETAEAQLGFLANLGLGREDDVLLYQLDEMERLPRLWQQLMQSWRTGDMLALESFAMKDMRQQFPVMYDLLIRQRNLDWTPKIEAMFDTEATEMVLVGSLHLAGEDGLLAHLESKGYSIRQLP